MSKLPLQNSALHAELSIEELAKIVDAKYARLEQERCKLEAQDKKPAKAKKTPKKCVVENCTNNAKSRGKCKRHGGGLRCKQPQCTTSARPGGYCIAHGGGLCKVENCTTGARSGGLCLMHQRVFQIRKRRLDENEIYQPQAASSSSIPPLKMERKLLPAPPTWEPEPALPAEPYDYPKTQPFPTSDFYPSDFNWQAQYPQNQQPFHTAYPNTYNAYEPSLLTPHSHVLQPPPLDTNYHQHYQRSNAHKYSMPDNDHNIFPPP